MQKNIFCSENIVIQNIFYLLKILFSMQRQQKLQIKMTKTLKNGAYHSRAQLWQFMSSPSYQNLFGKGRTNQSKNDHRISSQKHAFGGENIADERRTAINKVAGRSVPKTHLLYILPLENLTLNSTDKQFIPDQSLSVLEIPLPTHNQKDIQRSILQNFDNWQSQFNGFSSSMLRLPLLNTKVLKIKANCFANIQLLSKQPPTRPYCMTLMFLLAKKQSQWRDEASSWAFQSIRQIKYRK